MKKMMKKISALLMAAIMVLAMSATAFAAEELPTTASITINNLTPGDNTTVKIYQVVSHDASKSDWVAVDWAANFVKFPEDSEVANIDWNGLKGYVEANKVPVSAEQTTDETTVTFEGLKAGAYLVIATGTDTEYSVMGVTTYKYDTDHNLLAPLAAEVDAKGEGYTVTKTLNGTETLVYRGQELKFDITSVFPSFAEGTENRKVSIKDIPTGQYVKEVKVYVGNMETELTEGTDYTLAFGDGSAALPAKENETVEVNFTPGYIGTENAHAAQTIKVAVTTVVTNVETIKNEAVGSHDDETTPVTTKTGSIKINKVDKDKNMLKGAQFSITKKDAETPLEFVKVSDGVYKLATDKDAQNAKVTVLDVGAADDVKGILKVQGLGEGTYEIEEVKAPDGYSIVEVEDVTLALDNDDMDEKDTENVEINVTNTKLSSLPSTGGIGTTIFTIGGCVIMIVAAGLYFTYRRKAK